MVSLVQYACRVTGAALTLASTLGPDGDPSVVRRRHWLLLGLDLHLDRHAEEVAWRAGEAATERNGLAGITGNRNADQVASANQCVGWIELDPACARQVDLCPGVCCAAAN